MIPRKLERVKKDAGVCSTEPKITARWKSEAHRKYVRRHACIMCDASAPIEVAHVRLYGEGGMGRKPDDWRTVPLCRDCHNDQHSVGERTFWDSFGFDQLEKVIAHFIANSPKAHEIRRVMEERMGND